jgi:hypothetical protein
MPLCRTHNNSRMSRAVRAPGLRRERNCRRYLQQLLGLASGPGMGGRKSSPVVTNPKRPSKRITALITDAGGGVAARGCCRGKAASNDVLKATQRRMAKNRFMLTSVMHGWSALARILSRGQVYIVCSGIGGKKSTGLWLVILSMYCATNSARSPVSILRVAASRR